MSDFTNTQRNIGVLAIGSTIVAASGWRFVVRFLPMLPNRRARLTAALGSILLALVWPLIYGALVRLYLAHFVNSVMEHIDSRVMMIIVSWTFFPTAVFLGLGCGLSLNEKQRRAIGVTRKTHRPKI